MATVHATSHTAVSRRSANARRIPGSAANAVNPHAVSSVHGISQPKWK
jgi:hypothetical protein